MRRLVRLSAGTGLLALALVGLAPLGLGAAARAEVVGRVYVNDDTAITNTIAAFDRHADGGDATELTSSPIKLPAGATPFGIVVV